MVSNVELAWEHDTFRRCREYFGRYVRVLEFDKRGMAGSDRFEEAPTLEQRIDDVDAVMVVGSFVRTDGLVRTNMIKTLTRTGNSLALVLDRRILQATGIDADTKLEVSTDGDVIVISPVRSKKRTDRLRKVLDDLDREHAGAFRRLAE